MAFIIPNATDTASGAKYENLDQAEPDSLDFEILGNVGRSGVLTGCAVTSATSSTAVSVSSGTIVLNGVPYPVTGTASFSLPSAPTDYRFDLVVARVSGGTATLTAVQGSDEVTNPEFPKSVNSLASGVAFDGSIHIDLNTDVVLAAVYRQGSSTITTSRIVDRRTFVSSSVVSQGTTAPSPSSGSVGELYFSSNQSSGTNSGLYVKASAGWVPIQQNVGPQLPVGAAIAWPSSASIPTGYIEASGQSVSSTTYPELAAAWGKSGTFTLPDMNNGRVLKGTSHSSGTQGSTTGSDTVTLVEGNLPSHSHSLNSHTHTLSHDHTLSHTHSATTSSAGSHSHSAATQYSAFNIDWAGDTSVVSPNPFDVYRGDLNSALTGTSTADIRWFFGWKGPNAPSVVGPSVLTASTPSHSHTVTTTSQSDSTTSGASATTTSSASGNTGTTGTGTAVSTVQKSMYVTWIIRVTSGDSYPAGTSIYEEAREEVLALSYEGTLPTGSASDISALRLPWSATLTGVKASLDGVGVTASGDITVDVKVDGTSVLGANKITIENGESSSKTAATQADISTSALADDSLVSIDITAANGETGPLNVVLYLSRTA